MIPAENGVLSVDGCCCDAHFVEACIAFAAQNQSLALWRIIYAASIYEHGVDEVTISRCQLVSRRSVLQFVSTRRGTMTYEI